MTNLEIADALDARAAKAQRDFDHSFAVFGDDPPKQEPAEATLYRAAAQKLRQMEEEREDALDAAWRAVDAEGGVGAHPEYATALDHACTAIERLGGMDPVLRRAARTSAAPDPRP